MQITAQQLATLLNGTIEGNPEVVVNRPAKIEEAEAGTLTFLANLKYEPFLYTTRASIVLIEHDFVPAQPVAATLIRVKNVYTHIAFLLDKFGANLKENATSKHISPKASIYENVQLGENTSVGDFSVIENGVVIGDNCIIYPQTYIGKNVILKNNVTIHPGVRIYQDCVIGNNCIIHANVVIGADGFGFVPQPDGTYQKVAQIGNVVLEDNVEIGANTTIDRATMGSTIIRKGVKLDNLIQIGHNVEVGENTVIAAQTGVAGSTKIGANCQIGGQVGFGGHLHIADNTRIQGKSGITGSIKEAGKILYGYPALGYIEFMRAHTIFKQLPALEKRVRGIGKKERLIRC